MRVKDLVVSVLYTNTGEQVDLSFYLARWGKVKIHVDGKTSIEAEDSMGDMTLDDTPFGELRVTNRQGMDNIRSVAREFAGGENRYVRMILTGEIVMSGLAQTERDTNAPSNETYLFFPTEMIAVLASPEPE